MSETDKVYTDACKMGVDLALVSGILKPAIMPSTPAEYAAMERAMQFCATAEDFKPLPNQATTALNPPKDLEEQRELLAGLLLLSGALPNGHRREESLSVLKLTLKNWGPGGGERIHELGWEVHIHGSGMTFVRMEWRLLLITGHQDHQSTWDGSALSMTAYPGLAAAVTPVPVPYLSPDLI